MPYEQQYWSKYQKKMVKTVQLFSYFQFPTFISSFLIDNNASLKKNSDCAGARHVDVYFFNELFVTSFYLFPPR